MFGTRRIPSQNNIVANSNFSEDFSDFLGDIKPDLPDLSNFRPEVEGQNEKKVLEHIPSNSNRESSFQENDMFQDLFDPTQARQMLTIPKTSTQVGFGQAPFSNSRSMLYNEQTQLDQKSINNWKQDGSPFMSYNEEVANNTRWQNNQFAQQNLNEEFLKDYNSQQNFSNFPSMSKMQQISQQGGQQPSFPYSQQAKMPNQQQLMQGQIINQQIYLDPRQNLPQNMVIANSQQLRRYDNTNPMLVQSGTLNKSNQQMPAIPGLPIRRSNSNANLNQVFNPIGNSNVEQKPSSKTANQVSNQIDYGVRQQQSDLDRSFISQENSKMPRQPSAIPLQDPMQLAGDMLGMPYSLQETQRLKSNVTQAFANPITEAHRARGINMINAQAIPLQNYNQVQKTSVNSTQKHQHPLPIWLQQQLNQRQQLIQPQPQSQLLQQQQQSQLLQQQKSDSQINDLQKRRLISLKGISKSQQSTKLAPNQNQQLNNNKGKSVEYGNYTQNLSHDFPQSSEQERLLREQQQLQSQFRGSNPIQLQKGELKQTSSQKENSKFNLESKNTQPAHNEMMWSHPDNLNLQPQQLNRYPSSENQKFMQQQQSQHQQHQQQQVSSRLNDIQSSRLQSSLSDTKNGNQFKYQNEFPIPQQQDPKYNVDTQEAAKTSRMQQQEKINRQQKNPQQLQYINHKNQIQTNPASQIQPTQLSNFQSQQSQLRSNFPSQIQHQQLQKSKGLETQHPQLHQNQQYLSKNSNKQQLKRNQSENSNIENFSTEDRLISSASLASLDQQIGQAGDLSYSEQNFQYKNPNNDPTQNRNNLMQSQPGVSSRQNIPYLTNRPQSLQSLQFQSLASNHQKNLNAGANDLSKTQKDFPVYTPKSIQANQSQNFGDKYSTRKPIIPNYQLNSNKDEIKRVSKPLSQPPLQLQQLNQQRTNQNTTQRGIVQSAIVNIPQNNHGQAQSAGIPSNKNIQIARLGQVIQSLNLTSNIDDYQSILAKLPPDVLNSLNSSQPLFENMLLPPKSDILNNKRELSLNPSLARDPKVFNPAHYGFSFPSGQPVSCTSQTLPEASSLFTKNRMIDTKTMSENAILFETSQRDATQKLSRKSSEIGDSVKSPEKVQKYRKLRKIATSNPTANPFPKKNQFESKMTPEISSFLDSLNSEASDKKGESDVFPKRNKLKKRRIIDSEDELDDLYNKKDDDEYFSKDKKKKYAKKNTNQYLTQTHRYQKVEQPETSKRKTTLKPTISSKKEAQITYSEFVKSLALIEKLECLEDFQNLKTLPVKKGKCITNPFYEIIREMTGIAFWFYICAEYFPKAPFIQRSTDDLFISKQSGLKPIAMEFSRRISKTIQGLDAQNLSELNENEMQLYDNIYKLLKQKELEFGAIEPKDPLLQNLSLDAVYKNDYTLADDQWILEIRCLLNSYVLQATKQDCSNSINILKKIELSDAIAALQNECMECEETNAHRFETLKNKVEEEMKLEAPFLPSDLDVEDICSDLKIKLQDEEQYISFLEKKQTEAVNTAAGAQLGDKQNKQSVSNKRPKANSEDIDCQICKGGESEEDNPIVFCSVRIISLYFSIII